MPVEVVLCQKPKQIRDFLEVPFLLHKNDPNWVPPLRLSVRRILDKKNPFYKNAEVQLWVAYSDHQPVGRIAGIRNETHNQFYGEYIAFWGFFEASPSDEIASALFATIETWATGQGITELRGPMNPSINYECGIQISAFNDQPFVMMPQNPEYYPALIENQGYRKAKDIQAWRVYVQDVGIDSKKVKIIDALRKRYDVCIRKANIKEFTNELKLISTIYNDAWNEHWGYLPWDFEAFNYLAADLKSIIDPDLIYIAEVSG
ncbi:MAG: hypothetical protein ACRCXC_12850 [Legionella sp.]